MLPVVVSRLHPLRLRSCVVLLSARASSTATNQLDVGQQLLACYQLLGLEPDCEKSQLKERYLELARRYHPDTGGQEADASQFNRINEAYQTISRNDYSDADRTDLEEAVQTVDHGIRHTAPQHRQYLEFEGVGGGTPTERQRQYQQYRVQRANENVHEYMLGRIVNTDVDSKFLATTPQQAKYTHKWKTVKKGMDRLVEDLIVESMQKGEFDNLPGAGKPQKPQNDYNPYVDDTTHRMNKILVQNGFCPQWVTLEKEVKDRIRQIRADMLAKRVKLGGQDTETEVDWTQLDATNPWQRYLHSLVDDFAAVNKQIDRLNLIVPGLSRQMVHLTVQREARKAILAADSVPKCDTNTGVDSVMSDPSGVLGAGIANDKSANTGSVSDSNSLFKTLLSAFQLKK